MRKRIYFYLSAVILIALIFAVFGCSVEQRAKRKYFKALKMYPELIDSVTTSDTVVVVDSVTIHTTNTIRETEIDSIIIDCPDAVKPAIKQQIKSRCTIESILNGAHIFRLINGTGVLTATGNDPHLRFETSEIRTETTIYTPSERCEEEKAAMEKRHKSENRSTWMSGFLFGFFALAALILLIFALVKWGFR